MVVNPSTDGQEMGRVSWETEREVRVETHSVSIQTDYYHVQLDEPDMNHQL